MEIKKSNKSGSRIEFKISIEWDVVSKSIKDAYDKIGRFARIDGFRRGKIPRHILEERFQEKAKGDAIEELIRKTTQEILKNEDIKPLTDPLVGEVIFKKEDSLSFNIEFEIMPSFELDYKNIKILQKKIKIDDKKIDEHLEILRKEKEQMKEKEGKIEKGDIAVIDLISFPPSGKPVEHHGLYIEIGGSSFPEALENELIGMSRGDEKFFEIMMPADTEDKRLASSIVKFKASILAVKERILPKIDDDFAKEVGNFKNIKELREKIRENLTKIEEEKEREYAKNQMIDELFKRGLFDVPESLVKEEYKRMLLTFLYNLKTKNIPFERFLKEQNKTEEDFYKELKNEAEKKTKVLLILERIAELENISVFDIEYEEWVKRNFKEEARKEALSPEKRKILEGDLRIEKTLDFLVNK